MSIHSDTRVFTPDGYRLISEIKVGDKVLTKKGYVGVTDIKSSGIRMGFLVETYRNHNVILTTNHGVSTDGFTYTESKNLKRNDKVPIMSNYIKDEYEPNYFAYLSGIMLSEALVGSRGGRYHLEFKNNHTLVSFYVVSIMRDMGLIQYIPLKDLSAKKMNIQITPRFYEYLIKKGYLHNIYPFEKVSDKILEGNIPTLVSFLCGLIDGSSRVTQRYIELRVGKRDVHKLKDLLLPLGIYPIVNIDKIATIKFNFGINQPKLTTSARVNQLGKIEYSNLQIASPYHKSDFVETNRKKDALSFGESCIMYRDGELPYLPMFLDSITNYKYIGEVPMHDIKLSDEFFLAANGMYISQTTEKSIF